MPDEVKEMIAISGFNVRHVRMQAHGISDIGWRSSVMLLNHWSTRHLTISLLPVISNVTTQPEFLKAWHWRFSDRLLATMMPLVSYSKCAGNSDITFSHYPSTHFTDDICSVNDKLSHTLHIRISFLQHIWTVEVLSGAADRTKRFVNNMVQVWFPSMYMRLISGNLELISATTERTAVSRITLQIFISLSLRVSLMSLNSVNMARKPPQALLYIPPKMTKTEVKEYLTKIYSVKVLAVMTANFLGKIVSSIICNQCRFH